MYLVIAEKPSVAQSIAAVLGAKQRRDGFLEGGGYLVRGATGIWQSLPMPSTTIPIMKNGR